VRYEARLCLHGSTGGGVTEAEARGVSASGLQEMVEALATLSERELMEGVAEEFRFVLCGPCRGRVRADPAGASTVRPAWTRLPQ
jgi:hypothetical protein